MMQDADCNLAHEASTERLILSDDAVNEILKRPSAPHADPVRITLIDKSIPRARFTSSHPLHQIVKNIKGRWFNKESEEVEDVLGDDIRFTITRIDNLAFPTRGREVYLRVRVSINLRGWNWYL